MPSIYLSPSLQPFNKYLNGGNEQYYMNLIADEMEPFLISNGITFERNELGSNLTRSIESSNEGNFDLHLALHSNASPPSLTGVLKGIDVYYRPDNYQSKNAAEIIADNLKNIYPSPSLVKAVPTTTLSELNLVNSPSILIETGYHDNIDDVTWIKENTYAIASNIVESLTQFFDIPFISPPTPPKKGVVNANNVNVRSKPSTDSYIITRLSKDAPITILGQWENWYVINKDNITGYIFADFVTVQ